MSDSPTQSGHPTPPGGGGAVPADLGPRIGARLIDAVLMWIVQAVIIIPVVVTSLFGLGASGLGGGAIGFGFGTTALVTTLISIGVFLAYFVFLESMMGQTLGKMVLKLKVRGPGGADKPSFGEALKRNLWLVVGIVPVIGWLASLAAAVYIMVTINNNPDRRGWHDTFAGGTQVVKTA